MREKRKQIIRDYIHYENQRCNGFRFTREEIIHLIKVREGTLLSYSAISKLMDEIVEEDKGKDFGVTIKKKPRVIYKSIESFCDEKEMAYSLSTIHYGNSKGSRLVFIRGDLKDNQVKKYYPYWYNYFLYQRPIKGDSNLDIPFKELAVMFKNLTSFDVEQGLKEEMVSSYYIDESSLDIS